VSSEDDSSTRNDVKHPCARPSLDMLFQIYKVCMARITVRDEHGDLGNGAAFHIGEGYLVTARHVIEDGEIVEAVPEQYALPRQLTISRTFVPDDERVDLAILETDFSLQNYMEKVTIMRGDQPQEKRDFIPIGDHLDDWIGDELLLTRVLTMGYPRVPLSNDTRLIASLGEVNGVIDRYDGVHPHFVVSTMGRGGFSGAPVIHEWDMLLGVYTAILQEDV
jgi:S1-C subfamily serine protease